MAKDTIFQDEPVAKQIPEVKKKFLSPTLRSRSNYRDYYYEPIKPLRKNTRTFLIVVGSCLLTYLIKGLAQNFTF